MKGGVEYLCDCSTILCLFLARRCSSYDIYASVCVGLCSAVETPGFPP